jgi:two-component system, LytTR family, sensor kinase
MKRSWLVATALWGLVAALYTAQMVFISRQPGERIVLQTLLIVSLTYYLCWIPFTPPVWRISRTWTPDRLSVPGFIGRHLALGIAVSAMHTLLSVLLTGVFMSQMLSGLMLRGQVRNRLLSGLLMYGVIAAGGLVFTYYGRWRERELAAAQLETQLSDARLQSLKAQLHPHFLFNSLHAVASLIRTGDTAGAVRMIGGLSELLRRVLDADAEPTSTLADEAAFIERYFEIQRVRFGDRLRTSIDLQPGVENVRVPSLLLQPLVENAFRHGLADRIEAGAVSVRASRADGTLELTVEDDGAGLSGTSGSGLGLRNTRARLQQQFGDRYDLRIAPRPAGGTIVTIRVPA